MLFGFVWVPSETKILQLQGIWKWWEDSEQCPAMLPQLVVKEQCSEHPGIKLPCLSKIIRLSLITRETLDLANAQIKSKVFVNWPDTHSTCMASSMREKGRQFQLLHVIPLLGLCLKSSFVMQMFNLINLFLNNCTGEMVINTIP